MWWKQVGADTFRSCTINSCFQNPEILQRKCNYILKKTFEHNKFMRRKRIHATKIHHNSIEMKKCYVKNGCEIIFFFKYEVVVVVVAAEWRTPKEEPDVSGCSYYYIVSQHT